MVLYSILKSNLRVLIFQKRQTNSYSIQQVLLDFHCWPISGGYCVHLRVATLPRPSFGHSDDGRFLAAHSDTENPQRYPRRPLSQGGTLRHYLKKPVALSKAGIPGKIFL